MKNVIFLFSKDCVNLEALPMYGNKYWKTPNIDALAAKGTVFNKHYTAAPSTSMSMSAMLSGHYLHEFKSRMEYVSAEKNEFPSLFDYFQNKGYETHMIWDETWIGFCWKYVQLWGQDGLLQFHNLKIAQPAGSHKKSDERIVRNDDLLADSIRQIKETLSSIDLQKKQFIWLHLPHVIRGRCSYMDDVDVWDELVGYVRKIVGDDSIYITSDHGHMNMYKGKVGYGFDVYEPAIRIPLITPRIEGLEVYDQLTCNVDLWSIIVDHKIPKHKYIISDTQYYAQPNRKNAIVTERYKLITNRGSRTEELYDLWWDPLENFNILEESFYDKDRIRETFYKELYFYPYEQDAMKAYQDLKKIRDSYWREPSYIIDKKLRLKKVLNDNKRKWNNLRRKFKF